MPPCGQNLTAVAVGDPAFALLPDGEQYCLLLARHAHEESTSARLVLQTVSLIQLTGEWSCRELDQVTLCRHDGLWLAEAGPGVATVGLASPAPFAVLFISMAEYQQLQTFQAQKSSRMILRFVGRLSRRRPDKGVRLKKSDQRDADDGLFGKTHWTVIFAAGDLQSPNHQKALEQFCRTYRAPVYGFIRRKGKTPADADDLTQAFFLWLLQKNTLAKPTPERGKFRCFLRKVLNNFLINDWNYWLAQVRGGGKTIFSIDDATKTRVQRDLADHHTPETLFDRQWARTVMDEGLARLRKKYEAAGNQKLFDCLYDCLTGSSEDFSYAEAAQALEMSEEALRVALSRLKKRYGKYIRDVVAETVSSPEGIDDEIRHLIAILSGD